MEPKRRLRTSQVVAESGMVTAMAARSSFRKWLYRLSGFLGGLVTGAPHLLAVAVACS